MADTGYQESLQLYKRLPVIGKGLYDKALIGRIAAGSRLNKTEQKIKEIIPPPSSEQTYPVARTITHPAGTAVIGGAAAVGFKALKPRLMELARKQYMKFQKIKPVKGTFAGPAGAYQKNVSRVMRRLLLDPDAAKIITSPKRIQEVYKATPEMLTHKFVGSALLAGGAALLARHLHAKALMGEVMNETALAKQHDPSEYIRTKLRGDVTLKHQANALIKGAHIQENKAMDQTVAKLAMGVAEIMQKQAFGVSEAVEAGKDFLSAAKPAAKKALSATGKAMETGGKQIGGMFKKYPKAMVGGLAGTALVGGGLAMQKKEAAVLSTERREHMPKKEFAIPSHKTESNPEGEGAYPIPDKVHARNALARVSQHGSSAEKAEVRAKVHAKYPDIGEDHEKKSELDLLKTAADLIEKLAKENEDMKKKEKEKEREKDKKEDEKDKKHEGKESKEDEDKEDKDEDKDDEKKEAKKLSKEEFIKRFVDVKKKKK